MAKTVQKMRARKLRKNGLSIKEIARKLNVSVGSISNWCRDVNLTPEQIATLEKNGRDPYYGRRAIYLEKIKKRQDLKINRLKQKGIRKIGILSKRDLFVLGTALYWAEGFKKDKQVGLANQDPLLIKTFIRWLQTCFGYKLSDMTFRVTLNFSHLYRVDDIHKYWSTVLSIPISEFKKPTIQKFKWKKTYENPLTYQGVLRVKLRRSVDFLREIYGYIEGVHKDI